MTFSRRRLLSIAAVLMLLGAILHTIGNLTPATDPGLINLENSMRAFRFPFSKSMNPSMFDLFMALVLTMSLTFTALGILNLVLAAARDIPDGLLRRIVWINVIWVAFFVVLCWFYSIPPPLLTGIVIEAPLIAALLVKK